jgi:hypothetical protein
MSQYPLKITQVAGGNRNATFQIRGFVSGENLNLAKIHVSEGLKLSSALWIVQEKLTLHLLWGENDQLFPMESRNAARFDSVIKPPEGWNGTLYLSSSNWDQPTATGKSFFVLLDFDR